MRHQVLCGALLCISVVMMGCEKHPQPSGSIGLSGQEKTEHLTNIRYLRDLVAEACSLQQQPPGDAGMCPSVEITSIDCGENKEGRLLDTLEHMETQINKPPVTCGGD